ncbi:MAG TPA: hypothetical protein PLF81_30245 [Candidatus Anammoximicrobium sp.]|nr:hypothetical protein [Candidatus Anammoximicrobium sp.]
MTRFVIDQATKARLRDLREPLEICSESGDVLGYFTPAIEPAMYEGVVSPNSLEELARRSREGGGRRLADILRDLESRS